MSGRLEIYGNKKTFNFPEKVISNVLRSPYFRSLYELKTFNQVVDEIYNQVSYLEPWVAGKGIRVLLRHKDSPYIRALGFLYDEEPVVLKYNSQPTSIGKFVRELLSKPKFFDVVLPRIPVIVQREVEKQLNEMFPEDSQTLKKRKREDFQQAKEPIDKETKSKELSVGRRSLESEPSERKQQVNNQTKKSLESSFYLEDLKKRYGDTSGTLETRLTTQEDSETSTTQLPTAVKNYLQTY
ncbi:Pre-mRNA-splicing factor 38B [Galdieria sulphuraria]|nr:Pre-mRNA-splicing factor 38B [Galdieria sulphuraria]